MFLKTLTDRWSAGSLKVPMRLVFLVPLVIQVSLTAGLTGWLSFRNGQKAVNDLVTQLSLEVTNRTKERFDSFANEPHLFLQTIAATIRAGKVNPQDILSLERYFWHQTQISDRVTTLYFGDPQGRFLLVKREQQNLLYLRDGSTEPFRAIYHLDRQGNRLGLEKTDSYDPRTRPWYQTATQVGKPIWSAIYQFTALPVLGITPALPLYSEAGNLQGVLAIDMTLEQISHFLRGLKIGRSGQAFIMERSGQIVASSTTELPFVNTATGQQRLKATDSQNPLIRTAAAYLQQRFGSFNSIQEYAQFACELDGKAQFVTAAPLVDGRGLDWLMVVVIPRADFIEAIDANTQTTVVLCLAALLLAIAVGIVSARWIAEPIKRLSVASQAIAAGELDQEVQVQGVEELAILATSFNQMSKQVQESFSVLEQTNRELEQRVGEHTAKLQAAEAELRTLFAAMNELIFVQDSQGRYLKVAPTNPALLYKPIEHVLGKTLHEIFPPAIADLFLSYIQQALHSRQTLNVEYNLTISDRQQWFAASISPLSEDSVIWVARDITPRKQIELARQQSERQLLSQNLALMELAKNKVLYEGDLSAVAREVVEVAARTLEVERASVWLYHPNDEILECLDLFERSLDRHSEGAQFKVTNYPAYFKALAEDRVIVANDAIGDDRTQEFADVYLTQCDITALLDAPIRRGGQLVGTICIEQVRDRRRWTLEEQNFVGSLADLVSLAVEACERRRTETALRQAEEKYRTIFEHAVEGIFQTTPDGRFLSANSALARLYGYESPEELIASLTDIKQQVYVDPNCRDEFVRLVAEKGKVWGFEAQVYRKDGSAIWIAENAREVRDTDGTLLYYEGSIEDISDRKRFESAMQMALEAAEAASTAKSAFLANMSHELRTPLNAIIGYSEILKEEIEDLGYEDFLIDLDRIRGAGKHLLALINDILDISKIEAGRMELYLETFDIGALMTDVSATAQPLIEKNGNRLEVKMSKDLGFLYADSTKVRQVLLNLLSNAAKFTQNGKISLTAERVLSQISTLERSDRDAEVGDRESIVFRCTDTGIGMTPEQLKRLFQPFTQGDASTTRKYGGTGLGLAISQRFCEMMGGEIAVKSQVNIGSTFIVRLPTYVELNNS